MSLVSEQKNKFYLIPALLLLLGAGLRFHQLGHTLGGGDENEYLLEFADAPLKYIATTYHFGGHHVFHTLLMRLMIMGFGDENAIAIRFPVFLSGVACLWLIYKVALQLFDSLFIARLSLLIAAICPIHIYYSQFARGYSLIMFFSITMVYAALKLLDSPQKTRWGTVLVLCGALSIYTIPTNVYFVAALAGWLCLALLAPRYAEEIKAISPGTTALFFLFLFLLMALLTYLLYLPLLDQIYDVRKYHSTVFNEGETSKLIIAGKVPAPILSLIFPGPLAWFLPLLAVGALFGNTVRRSYRLLPLCVLLLPLIFPLLTGVSGYARSYLYNLPLLVIFFAAGIVKAGQIVNRRSVGIWIAAIYTLFSLKLVFFEHYPSIQTLDGKLYQQVIRENSSPLDLIAIADPEDYLYAKSIYRDNFKNIVQQNKLTGIKLIMRPGFEENNKKDKDIHFLPFLKEMLNFKGISPLAITHGKELVSIAGVDSLSVLDEDFESKANWEVVSGKGKITFSNDHKLFGKSSILIEAEKGKNMILRAPINQKLHIGKPAYIVLFWTNHGFKNHSTQYHPMLTLLTNANGAISETQLRLEKANEGINLIQNEDSLSPSSYDWSENAVVGRIPPGDYNLNMFLMCPGGESIVYDGFRLFFIEIPIDILTPALQKNIIANQNS